MLVSSGEKTSSVSLLYVILPLILGISLDILFTQIIGSQYCILNKTEYTCTIHGIHITQWQREAIRFLLQLGLIMSVILILQNVYPSSVIPLYTSLNGVIGLLLMFISQTDLFSDFRRLCNGLVFSLKHNY